MLIRVSQVIPRASTCVLTQREPGLAPTIRGTTPGGCTQRSRLGNRGCKSSPTTSSSTACLLSSCPPSSPSRWAGSLSRRSAQNASRLSRSALLHATQLARTLHVLRLRAHFPYIPQTLQNGGFRSCRLGCHLEAWMGTGVAVDADHDG
eukprot:2004566-Rhodomonas_salina.5